MNPALAYAIEHQAKAKAILVASCGVRPGDVEDVSQDVLLSICRANPLRVGSPSGYWSYVLHTAALNYYRRKARQPFPLQYDKPDPRQDPEATAICHEDLREAWAIATPCQRRAVVHKLNQDGHGLNGADRIALHHLRRRLRERTLA